MTIYNHFGGARPLGRLRGARQGRHYVEGGNEILYKIEQLFCPADWDNKSLMSSTKLTSKQMLAIACPTCDAQPGQKCELGTGEPRHTPHRDRRLVAGDIKLRDGIVEGLGLSS